MLPYHIACSYICYIHFISCFGLTQFHIFLFMLFVYTKALYLLLWCSYICNEFGICLQNMDSKLGQTSLLFITLTCLSSSRALCRFLSIMRNRLIRQKTPGNVEMWRKSFSTNLSILTILQNFWRTSDLLNFFYLGFISYTFGFQYT